jgi:hypothetical protein
MMFGSVGSAAVGDGLQCFSAKVDDAQQCW